MMEGLFEQIRDRRWQENTHRPFALKVEVATLEDNKHDLHSEQTHGLNDSTILV